MFIVCPPVRIARDSVGTAGFLIGEDKPDLSRDLVIIVSTSDRVCTMLARALFSACFICSRSLCSIKGFIRPD
jgi:hypothetical protein